MSSRNLYLALAGSTGVKVLPDLGSSTAHVGDALTVQSIDGSGNVFLNFSTIGGGAGDYLPLTGTALTVSNNATITGTLAAGATTINGSLTVATTNLFQVGSVTGSNNVMRLTPVAAGSRPSITTIGADTNIDLDVLCQGAGNIRLRSPTLHTSTVGFNNTAPIAKPTISGSRGSNAALASLLTALASYGLVTDSTTA